MSLRTLWVKRNAERGTSAKAESVEPPPGGFRFLKEDNNMDVQDLLSEETKKQLNELPEEKKQKALRRGSVGCLVVAVSTLVTTVAAIAGLDQPRTYGADRDSL